MPAPGNAQEEPLPSSPLRPPSSGNPRRNPASCLPQPDFSLGGRTQKGSDILISMGCFGGAFPGERAGGAAIQPLLSRPTLGADASAALPPGSRQTGLTVRPLHFGFDPSGRLAVLADSRKASGAIRYLAMPARRHPCDTCLRAYAPGLHRRRDRLADALGLPSPTSLRGRIQVAESRGASTKRRPSRCPVAARLSRFCLPFTTALRRVADFHRARKKPPSTRFPRGLIGCDIAKHTDWTVLIAIDRRTGACVGFERFNYRAWPIQKDRILAFCREWRGLLVMDATGAGDPIFDDLSVVWPRIEAVKFTNQTKTELIQRLIVATEQKQVSSPWRWRTRPGTHSRTIRASRFFRVSARNRLCASQGVHCFNANTSAGSFSRLATLRNHASAGIISLVIPYCFVVRLSQISIVCQSDQYAPKRPSVSSPSASCAAVSGWPSAAWAAFQSSVRT